MKLTNCYKMKKKKILCIQVSGEKKTLSKFKIKMSKDLEMSMFILKFSYKNYQDFDLLVSLFFPFWLWEVTFLLKKIKKLFKK